MYGLHPQIHPGRPSRAPSWRISFSLWSHPFWILSWTLSWTLSPSSRLCPSWTPSWIPSWTLSSSPSLSSKAPSPSSKAPSPSLKARPPRTQAALSLAPLPPLIPTVLYGRPRLRREVHKWRGLTCVPKGHSVELLELLQGDHWRRPAAVRLLLEEVHGEGAACLLQVLANLATQLHDIHLQAFYMLQLFYPHIPYSVYVFSACLTCQCIYSIKTITVIM